MNWGHSLTLQCLGCDFYLCTDVLACRKSRNICKKHKKWGCSISSQYKQLLAAQPTTMSEKDPLMYYFQYPRKVCFEWRSFNFTWWVFILTTIAKAFLENMDVNFLRVGTESVHLVLRQQEDGGKEQYHRLTEPDHIFHIFSSGKWKVRENSHLRVRNGAQVGSIVTRESVYPSIWCQILFQPVGRIWKPTQPWWIEPYEQQLFWSAFLDGFLFRTVKLTWRVSSVSVAGKGHSFN